MLTSEAVASRGSIRIPAWAPQGGSDGARVPRRKITPASGRCIEMLGHAIEYVYEQAVHEGAAMLAGDPEVEAMQILMWLQRAAYFQCPPVVSLWERIRTRLAQLAGIEAAQQMPGIVDK